MAVAAFLVTVAAIEIAARVIEPRLPPEPGKWPRLEMGTKYEQMRSLSDDRDPIPVLFTGSSMMASGIDPNVFTRRTGLESYNAAVAGPGMTALRPWILEVTQPLLSSETVVLGIQSRELNDDEGVIAHFHDVLTRSPGFNLATPSSPADHMETWLDRVSAFFRNRRAFRSPTTMFEDRGRRGHRVGPRGVRRQEDRFYRHRLKLAGREAGVPFRNPGPRHLAPPDAFAIGGPQYAALNALSTDLSRRDVDLVLLLMPVTRDYRLAYPHIRERFFDALDRVARKRGVTVIDAQDAFPREGPFRDPIHLDVEGRVSLSTVLGEEWDLITGGSGYFRVTCDDDFACRLRPLRRLRPSARMTPGRRHKYLSSQDAGRDRPPDDPAIRSPRRGLPP